MTIAVHSFERSLEQSQKDQESFPWENIYRQKFPNLLSINRIKADGWAQRGGVDTTLVLNSSRTVRLDEKLRAQDYDDILLERWSDKQRKQPGWVQKDLACDYIAYAFKPSQRCYFLPFLDLRQAWRCYGPEWIKRYGTREAVNERWVTESVPVPISVLLSALSEIAVVTAGGDA